MAYKKSSLLTSLLLSSALVLAACGDEEEVTEPVGDQSQTDQPVSTDDASPGGGIGEDDIGGEIFGFTEFDLNVDYPDQDDALDVSYEEDRDEISAEYENKVTGDDLAGDDAMNEIEPAFGQIDVDADTPDDEVISQAIEAFGIEDNYTSIEIEIRYPDGNEKEYEATQNQ
ncbi:YusW family protein [Planococcus salinus]|nr:YusW family protein [Planococcus salinus]